jgi:penicillin-binding protein 2
MERVVKGEAGTARRLASLPVVIAGKTGTSQVVRKQEGVRWQDLPWEQRHHALFVGYAPVEAPELVVVVVVEHGGDAAQAAAPIAGRILQRAFGPPPEGDSGLVAQAPNVQTPAEPTPEAGPVGSGRAAP